MDLVSWNIQWGKGCDGVVDLARIVRDARALADADVFCFQEIAINYPVLDAGKGEDQPAALGRLLPGYTIVFRPAVDVWGLDGSPRQFRNPIAPRLPALPAHMPPLPRPADPGGRNMQRQALEVVVDAPGGPLRVVTTHIEYY